MYHSFFGLEEQAFSIAVDPRYLYMSEQHREALAHLLYGIQTGGFVQLTGEVGTGKTTLVRCLLEQLPEQTDIAMILNPMASVNELLSSICDELDVPYITDEVSTKILTDALYDFLLRNHARGRSTVLLIDEAQLLSPQALEQVRLLTNLETSTTKLLNIILVGQPELIDVLAQPSLRQLSQRITARFHLQPLSLEETSAYINHRLSVAGGGRNPVVVPAQIAHRVYRFSGGVPRLINVICERMLLGAYAKNLHTLDAQIFAQAEREVRNTPRTTNADGVMGWLRHSPDRWSHSLAAALGGLSVALLVVILLALTDHRSDSSTPGAMAASATPAPAPEEPMPDAGVPTEVAELELEPEPEPEPEPAAREFWSLDMALAQTALFDYLELEPGARNYRCPSSSRGGFQCESQQLETWDDLIALDRPVVLTLISPERRRAYTTLIGLDEHRALLFWDGEQRAVPWSYLGRLWNGQVHYLWYRPAGFQQTLALGDRGEAVDWLAAQFARLDDQPYPLTRSVYSPSLRQRVQIFQRQHQLADDGILGHKTLQHLNQALGLEKSLLTPPAGSAEDQRQAWRPD